MSNIFKRMFQPRRTEEDKSRMSKDLAGQIDLDRLALVDRALREVYAASKLLDNLHRLAAIPRATPMRSLTEEQKAVLMSVVRDILIEQ